jgi:NADPH-dependent glutamate synthase beta subunit-like oxidoreductase
MSPAWRGKQRQVRWFEMLWISVVYSQTDIEQARDSSHTLAKYANAERVNPAGCNGGDSQRQRHQRRADEPENQQMGY